MTLKGLKSLQKEVERIKKELPHEVNEAVQDGLSDTEHHAKRRLVRQDAVHTTDTYRGFYKDRVKLVDGTRHSLTNRTTHAPYVEWGTGDHFGTSQFLEQPSQRFDAPSMSARLVNQLRFWIQTKPSFRTSGPVESEAVGIARRISGLTDRPSGTPPQPFMRPAWQIGKRTVVSESRRAVKKVLR